MRSSFKRITTVLLCSSLLGASGVALAQAGAGAAAATTPGSPGVWQPHELEFQYIGFTTIYSCDGLRDKLRSLLRRAGAREDASVYTYSCVRGEGSPDRFVRAKLKFSTLQPLEGADATSATAAPSGAWHTVQLAPMRPFELDAGDCELIEQFRDKLLPLFSARALQDGVRCQPHQNPANYDLRFEVFAPTPAPAKPAGG